ncbi:MAG: hypothetical protein Q8P24_15045 [Desulfobacterales bacterium]|nr:hypothetical protein [Desulfobacterales bacterium]
MLSKCGTLLMSLMLGSCLWSSSIQADSSLVGMYRCRSYNVSGGGGSCRLAPPMVLNSDGTYNMSSEHGTYEIKDDQIFLSKSKIRGPGKIKAGHQIVFEYSYRGLQHTVTYGCQDCQVTDPSPSSPVP